MPGVLGGCSVGWAGVGWGRMSQEVAQDEIEGPVEPVAPDAPVMALGVALPEALDGEENDRAFVVDPDSEIEDEGSSDEELAAFDGMVPRALRDQLARLADDDEPEPEPDPLEGARSTSAPGISYGRAAPRGRGRGGRGRGRGRRGRYQTPSGRYVQVGPSASADSDSASDFQRDANFHAMRQFTGEKFVLDDRGKRTKAFSAEYLAAVKLAPKNKDIKWEIEDRLDIVEFANTASINDVPDVPDGTKPQPKQAPGDEPGLRASYWEWDGTGEKPEWMDENQRHATKEQIKD
eukprot:COSAG05_NODE_69_length_22151_cov_124.775258_6_plen_292_part_00